MAQHKLNLVKSRIISSKEELIAFKRDATSALLKFADSNDCDLDQISQLLCAKYAEIDKALAEGNRVETEVEIYPQPESPVQKQACMQRIAEPLHQPLPVQQDEGNPEAQDPADLLEAQQEREIAESNITMEDILKLMSDSPEKQEVAGDIMQAAPQLGEKTAWALVTRVAHGAYSLAELATIKSALKVMAAEEGEAEEAGSAPAPEGDEGGVITHEPKEKVTPSAIEGFNFAAVDDLVVRFNKILAEVDPEMQMLPPITIEEIQRKLEQAKGADHVVPEITGDPTVIEQAGHSHAGGNYVLPAFSQLAQAEKDALMEGVEVGDEDNMIDQWYAENGLDVIADMAKGVQELLTQMGEEQITGQQIVDQFLADSGGKGHITAENVKALIGESKGSTETEESRRYKANEEENALRQRADEFERRKPEAEAAPTPAPTPAPETAATLEA
jgi:hypothetical protein